VIYGRRPRQLLVVWGFSMLLILLIIWLETQAPVLHELVLPFYWIIIAVAFYLTWRWLRARSKKDRRGGDRRHADRRDQKESTRNDSPGSASGSDS
jgi:membrane protein implicated in regulation of membrane protease activity